MFSRWWYLPNHKKMKQIIKLKKDYTLTIGGEIIDPNTEFRKSDFLYEDEYIYFPINSPFSGCGFKENLFDFITLDDNNNPIKKIMKTPEQLKEIQKAAEIKQKQELAKKEQEYKDKVKRDKEIAISKAINDVDKAMDCLEKLVENNRFKEYDNTKYYEIKNYHKTYQGQLDYWFYDDQNKDYWIQLAKELKTKGFKAISEHYDTEVYDSMTTYTHYYIRVVL